LVSTPQQAKPVDPVASKPAKPKNAEQILSERTKGLDLSPHPSKIKQLSSKRMSELKKKIDNRTITKIEHAQYRWNEKIDKARRSAVRDFWDKEITRIAQDKPTRPWTVEQTAQINARKPAQFSGQSLQGHHTYSVSQFPHLAGKHEVIWPATFKEHLYGWHGGKWSTSLLGKPISIQEINEIFLKEILLR
jgi:hypothetical protein